MITPLYLVRSGGFEPLACRLGGDRSILLSYERISTCLFYSRHTNLSMT